jgi:hypothetical protein
MIAFFAVAVAIFLASCGTVGPVERVATQYHEPVFSPVANIEFVIDGPASVELSNPGNSGQRYYFQQHEDAGTIQVPQGATVFTGGRLLRPVGVPVAISEALPAERCTISVSVETVYPIEINEQGDTIGATKVHFAAAIDCGSGSPAVYVSESSAWMQSNRLLLIVPRSTKVYVTTPGGWWLVVADDNKTLVLEEK